MSEFTKKQEHRPAWLDSPLAPTEKELEAYRMSSAKKIIPLDDPFGAAWVTMKLEERERGSR